MTVIEAILIMGVGVVVGIMIEFKLAITQYRTDLKAAAAERLEETQRLAKTHNDLMQQFQQCEQQVRNLAEHIKKNDPGKTFSHKNFMERM